MSDAPERIWASSDRSFGRADRYVTSRYGIWDTEYIRADLVHADAELAKQHHAEAFGAGVDLSPQWLPIDSAPRDGTVIWVLMPTALGHGKFSDGAKKSYWMEDLGEWQVEGVGGNIAPEPIGWTPIPKPPT